MKVKSLKDLKVDDVLLCIYCVVYIAITMLPMLKYSISYVVSGSYCLLPVALCFLRFSGYRENILGIAVSGLICGGITWLLYNGGLTEIINVPINFLRFFMPCLLFYALSKASVASKQFVWIVSAVLMLFVAFKTSSAIDTNETVARLLANGSMDEELTKYRMDNVGGFGFCYAVGFTFPMWFSTVIDTKVRWVKLFAVVLAIITFLFVLKAQYMILFIMCIFTVLLVFIYRPGDAAKKMFIVVAVLGFILILPYVLRLITRLNIGSHIAGKINNVAAFLDGSVTAENTTSRIGKYREAFLEFIRSPLLGTTNSKAAIKAHSTWLTLGCNNGIIGIASFAYMLSSGYRCVSKTVKEYSVNIIPFIITFVTLIVLALVNPIEYSYEISFVVFLFVPLTMLLFGEKKDGKENAELGT